MGHYNSKWTNEGPRGSGFKGWEPGDRFELINYYSKFLHFITEEQGKWSRLVLDD